MEPPYTSTCRTNPAGKYAGNLQDVRLTPSPDAELSSGSDIYIFEVFKCKKAGACGAEERHILCANATAAHT